MERVTTKKALFFLVQIIKTCFEISSLQTLPYQKLPNVAMNASFEIAAHCTLFEAEIVQENCLASSGDPNR